MLIMSSQMIVEQMSLQMMAIDSPSCLVTLRFVSS
jgi:hypothetical protein